MNKSVKVLLFIIFVLVVVAGFLYINSEFRSPFFEVNFEAIMNPAEPDSKEIVPSQPLHGPVEEVQSHLTVEGIISETNKHRRQNGLPELSTNSALAHTAEIKVGDMFERQYFAHESPTGEGPGDLADVAGYEYLLVGENLAVGNFENDAVLVQAWMDSPGHRENILNPNFSELGVHIDRGVYLGNTVWMAVQEFGRPASDCPLPDEGDNNEIQENQETLVDLERELEASRRRLENARRGREYNRMVEEHNELVEIFNTLVEETKILIESYNKQVGIYNECISQ